jgi:hypothetical protein
MPSPTNFDMDRALNHEMDCRYRESQPLFQQFWQEADMDTKIATGQQDFNNGYGYGSGSNRNQRVLQFNKILRVLNMVGGYQRKNRLQTIVNASQSGEQNMEDQETADQFTEVLNWCKRQDNTYEKISECFDGALMSGLNLMQVYMDFREDPLNGRIKTQRIPFNGLLMDPYWTQHDLSDCDWIWTRKYLTRPQVLSIFPDLKNDLPQSKQGPATKDGKFPFLPQSWYQYQYDLFYYDEYWKRDYKKVRKLLDRTTGEVVDWKGTREQFQLLRRFNPNVELITAMKPTVEYNVLINGHLTYKEQAPYGIDRYNFAPFLCYHFPEVQNYAWRYYGVPRNVRDSQIELNRRRNRMLDILDAQVQSGLMLKEDALTNPEDAFLQGPGKILFFKNSANLQTDQVQIQPTTWNQGMFEMAQMFDQEIMSIAGATDELFGESASGQDMSGFLSQLRMGAGLVSMQGIFDRLNESQKLVGEIMLDMVQANITPALVQDIIAKEPTQQFYDAEFSKYHCVCEEAAMTSTQRQLQFIQALQMKQMGIPISNEYLIKKSTIQGKKEIIDDIMQQEQQMAQAQQQQMQLEQLKLAQESRQLESVAQANFAAAEERKTRSLSNIGLASNHIAQSQRDDAAAALDNAKAMHELDSIPQERLIKLMDFIMGMQEREHAMSSRDLELAQSATDRATKDVRKAE